MHNEFAKWEIKTSVFSGRKPQAGNCCFLSLLAQAAVLASTRGPGCHLETCPRQFQGLFFWFFAGMPAAYFRNTIGDHLDTIQVVRSAAAQSHFTFGDCVPLRADL